MPLKKCMKNPKSNNHPVMGRTHRETPWDAKKCWPYFSQYVGALLADLCSLLPNTIKGSVTVGQPALTADTQLHVNIHHTAILFLTCTNTKSWPPLAQKQLYVTVISAFFVNVCLIFVDLVLFLFLLLVGCVFFLLFFFCRSPYVHVNCMYPKYEKNALDMYCTRQTLFLFYTVSGIK